MKEIDLNQSVQQMVTTYPETAQIMYELGFKSILEPGMLKTAGRYMTLVKGVKMKKIPMETIKAAFAANGFILKGA